MNIDERNKIVEQYVNLVGSIAVKRLTKDYEQEDLFQEGMVGLILAIDKYEPDKGPFDKFVKLYIERMIFDYKLNSGLIRKPRRIPKKQKNTKRVPEIDSYEKIIFVTDGKVVKLIDTFQSENNFDGLILKDLANELNKLIRSFSNKEKYVLKAYYKDRLSMKEIGTVIGVNESRVSQILSRIYDKLRNNNSLESLKVYLHD
jgi:RNA polymerase sigma factor FliA